jgi:hypothetical protein
LELVEENKGSGSRAAGLFGEFVHYQGFDGCALGRLSLRCSLEENGSGILA